MSSSKIYQQMSMFGYENVRLVYYFSAETKVLFEGGGWLWWERVNQVEVIFIYRELFICYLSIYLSPCVSIYYSFNYHPFHKTFPRSSAFINWISVRFYKTDYKTFGIIFSLYNNKLYFLFAIYVVLSLYMISLCLYVFFC